MPPGFPPGPTGFLPSSRTVGRAGRSWRGSGGAVSAGDGGDGGTASIEGDGGAGGSSGEEPEEQYLPNGSVEEAQELVVEPLEVVEDQVKGQVEVQ